MRLIVSILTCASMMLAASAASAHEFWIEVANWRPQVSELVRVHIRVGEQFRGSPVVRDASRFHAFVCVDPQGARTDVVGLDGRDPAGVMRADSPGLHIVAYHGTHRLIEHEPGAFEDYLSHDGLDHLFRGSRETNDSQANESAPIREVYSRCAKALVRAGGGASEGFDRVLGLPLEIVPAADPFKPIGSGATTTTSSVEKGDPEKAPGHPFIVLFRGKPVADVLVVAVNEREPEKRFTGRTDSRGRVELPLAQGGVWLVSCVHMERAEGRALEVEVDGEPVQADFESFWASLTFSRVEEERAATTSEKDR